MSDGCCISDIYLKHWEFFQWPTKNIRCDEGRLESKSGSFWEKYSCRASPDHWSDLWCKPIVCSLELSFVLSCFCRLYWSLGSHIWLIDENLFLSLCSRSFRSISVGHSSTMTNLGRCSDASCTELAGRLFECAHHCKKMVCLHHLIEHDRCVEQHHHELENLSDELRQLWTAYQSSIDEVKLRSEFEHRVKRHRQLLGDVSNLLANENVNHEQCRLVLEKLKQNIEQVKDLRRSPLDTTPPVEKVKMEPIEDMSMVSEFGKNRPADLSGQFLGLIRVVRREFCKWYGEVNTLFMQRTDCLQSSI